MTVQIVSRPPDRLIVCNHCECELSFTKLDILRHTSRIPGFDDYDFIDCPNCKFRVKVPTVLPPARR